MQQLWMNIDGRMHELFIPAKSDEVMPGVRWGASEEVFTPSFWKYQSEARGHTNKSGQHKLGENLFEEIAVCLLGGYGIPAEMGMVAFERLRGQGFLQGGATEEQMRASLKEPFIVGGRERRYRFAAQKASYLARSLQLAQDLDPRLHPRDLRDRLLTLPGIGPKTASWVVRNHTDADDVAIIDVHLHRACVMMDVFEPHSDPSKEYFKLEDLFLRFAEAIKVRASLLDAIIWDFMRRIGPTSRTPTQARQLSLSF